MVVPHSSSSMTAAAAEAGASSKPLSPSSSEVAGAADPTNTTSTMLGGKRKSGRITGGVVSSSDTESLSAAINRGKKFDSFSSSLDNTKKGTKSSFAMEQYHPVHQTVANGAGGVGKGINSSCKQEVVSSSRMWNESLQSRSIDDDSSVTGTGGDSVCCSGLSPSVGGGDQGKGIGGQAWIKDHKISQERSPTEDPFAVYQREEGGHPSLSPEFGYNSSPSSSTTGPTIVASCRGMLAPSDPGSGSGGHIEYTDSIKKQYQQESNRQHLTSTSRSSISTPAVSGSSSSSHMYQRSEKEDHVVRNCSRLSSNHSAASVSTTPSPCPGCPPGYHESILSSIHHSSSNPHLSELDMDHQSYFGGGTSGRIIGVQRGGGVAGLDDDGDEGQEVDLPLEPSDLLKVLAPPDSPPPSSSPPLLDLVTAGGGDEGEHEEDEIGRRQFSSSGVKKQLQLEEPFPLLHHVQQHRNLQQQQQQQKHFQRSLPSTLFRPHPSSGVPRQNQPGSSSFRSSSSASCQTQSSFTQSSGQSIQQRQQQQGFLERRSNEANRRRRLQNVMISRQAAQYEDDADEDDSIPPPPPPPSVSPSRLRPVPCYPNRTPRSKPRK